MPTTAQPELHRLPLRPRTVPVVLPRDVQRNAALARANEIRIARAALKREIAAGERLPAEVIAECPAEAHSMPVAELIGAQHRWGEARTLRLLRRAELSETKPLGHLTPRQRRALIACLEQPAL
ncbi:MAG: hypothetical protein ITG02_13725 [Patulibacter sp.]|nr:hypothetical protein [Patulibacter sp.]